MNPHANWKQDPPLEVMIRLMARTVVTGITFALIACGVGLAGYAIADQQAWGVTLAAATGAVTLLVAYPLWRWWRGYGGILWKVIFPQSERHP